MQYLAQLAQQLPSPWLLPALAVAVWASAVVGVLAWLRYRRGLAVLPYQPRRPVPWGPVDLLVVIAVYVLAMGAAVALADAILDPQIVRSLEIQNVDQADTKHAVARLLEGGTVWMLLLCGISAVVVAPIVEEFLFRVLLQGWLEAACERLRPKMPTLSRLAPGAVGPILLTSLLFAMMHFRVATPQRHPQFLIYLMIAGAAVSLLTMAIALGLLRVHVAASAADLGWQPKKFFADVRLGLWSFVAVVGPIYVIQIVLLLALPKSVAPDPIPLFFLALVLGILYRRTHRIVPAIVLHMLLNAASLKMAWALMRPG